MLDRRPRPLILAGIALACAAVAIWVWRFGDDDAGGRDGGTASASGPATPGDGALRWLGGEAGCLKGTAGRSWIPCRPTVRGQYDISSLAISPDGRFAYGVSLYAGYRQDAAGRRLGDVRGGTIVAFSRDRRNGALTQLKGSDACIRDHDAPLTPVTKPCRRRARGLAGAKTIVLSPDGRFAYVAALEDDAIAAFRRNRRTGALRQLRGGNACVGGPARECPRAGKALDGIRWIALSPDGRNLYAASPANDAIAAFSRDRRTGGLRQLPGADACIEDNLARPRSGCSGGVGLNYPRTIALSPDGRSAYVASDSADSTFPGDPANGDAVSAFSRDPRTGALRQLAGKAACIKDTIARATTACATVGRGLLDAFHVAVSPDGRHVYVGSDASRAGAIAIFRRDPATSELTQLPGAAACLGNGPGCRPAKGISGVDSITISANGRRVYATGFFGLSVAAFERDPESGGLTQLRGRGACVRDVTSKARCSRAVRGLQGPRDVVLSPDGKTAYVPSSVSGTITIFRVGKPPLR